jgi:transglutaminase-like putative cysteine protease
VPAFSDEARVAVVFPEFEVGDTSVFTYRVTTGVTQFPGQFATSEGFDEYARIKHGSISFDAPASLPVRHKSWNLKLVRDQVVGDRRVSEWSYQNLEPQKAGSLPLVEDREHRVAVDYSTFKSYEEVGRAYQALVQPKLQITARIRALADRIAGTRTDPREIARALYHWVSSSIHYELNDTGMGAYAPRDLDVVIDNKMGDCKDHATLLQALLKARGIESSQALINAGGAYDLSPIPSTAEFNHVITYVPSLDLYLDSTDDGMPFGFLPFSDAGRPVWLVDSNKLGQTPAIADDANRQISTSRFSVNADGDIEGYALTEAHGNVAAQTTSIFRAHPGKEYDQGISQGFASLSAIGSGSARMEHLDDPALDNPDLRFKVHFKIDRALSVPGATSLTDFTQSDRPVSSYVTAWLGEELPSRDVTCMPGAAQDSFEITFDPSLEIVAAPQDVSIEGPQARYTAKVEIKDNVVTATRSIESHAAGPRCDLAYVRAYRAFAGRVMAHLRSQIMFRPR